MLEEIGNRVDEYIIAAPSSINPGKLIEFFSKYRTGNKILEKLVLNKTALLNMLKFMRRMGFVDGTG